MRNYRGALYGEFFASRVSKIHCAIAKENMVLICLNRSICDME